MTSGTFTETRAHPIAWFGVRLHEVLDGLDAPAWSMTPEEQRSTLVELGRARARLEALELSVLAAADRNDVGSVDASPSTGAWLARATRQTRPVAHGRVRLAQALDVTAATGAALGAGAVNVAQATAIVKALAALPESAGADDRARAEQHLLELAAEHDAADLAGLGARIAEVLDPDAADAALGEKLAAEERRARRRTWLKLRDNGDGTVSGQFKIPALHAAMLATALDALTAPRRRTPDDNGDRPGRPELWGHGFCELLERCPADLLPTAGGVNATVVVTMTLEQLLSGLGAAGVITGSGSGLTHLSAGEARRLACAAGVIPAVLGGRSEVLDLGRRRRLHSKAQRLAMTLRDRHCTAEHCDRPATWCEAHHERPWSESGATTVADGRLLCPWHHHKAHDPAYTRTRLPTGALRFTRRQ
ncbi:MAG: DUF222 domain-containing protein [Nocardioidaceae bacterium]